MAIMGNDDPCLPRMEEEVRDDWADVSDFRPDRASGLLGGRWWRWPGADGWKAEEETTSIAAAATAAAAGLVLLRDFILMGRDSMEE